MSFIDMSQRGSFNEGGPTVCSGFPTGPSTVRHRSLGDTATSVGEMTGVDRTATLDQTRSIRREHHGDDGQRPLILPPPLPCRASTSSADGRLRTDDRARRGEEVPA